MNICERCQVFPCTDKSCLCEPCSNQLKILLESTEQAFREKISLEQYLVRWLYSCTPSSEDVEN